MIKQLLCILALTSTLAFADNNNTGSHGNGAGTGALCQGNCPNETSGTTTISVKPVIDTNARSRAEAWAAAQSRSQSSANSFSGDSNSGSYSGGNTQSINTTVNTNYPDKQRIYNVPNVNLTGIYPTSPCMGSSSVGGSGVGFGFGIGTSWTDDECSRREYARSFQGLGETKTAVEILCKSKFTEETTICKLDATSK